MDYIVLLLELLPILLALFISIFLFVNLWKLQDDNYWIIREYKYYVGLYLLAISVIVIASIICKYTTISISQVILILGYVINIVAISIKKNKIIKNAIKNKDKIREHRNCYVISKIYFKISEIIVDSKAENYDLEIKKLFELDKLLSAEITNNSIEDIDIKEIFLKINNELAFIEKDNVSKVLKSIDLAIRDNNYYYAYA